MKVQSLYDKGVVEKINSAIIFGANNLAIQVKKYLQEHRVKVICYFDNNIDKQGSELDGILIQRPELINEQHTTPIIIISNDIVNIIKQLQVLGYQNFLHAIPKKNFTVSNELSYFDPPSWKYFNVALVFPDEKLWPIEIDKILKHFNNYVKSKVKSVHYYIRGKQKEYYKKYVNNTALYSDTKLDYYQYHAVFFIQGDNDPFRWDWNPTDTLIISTRIYIIYRWDNIRCINRCTDKTDFEHIDAHRFYSLSKNDQYSNNVLFPQGYINRQLFIGPTDKLGFRITGDFLAYKNRPKDHKLICIFGGSAAWGAGCLFEETLSEQLQGMLNTKAKNSNLKLKFTVLNFAQPSAVVLNEICNYLLYVFRINPDIIISHSGYNDLAWGITSDPLLLNKYHITYQSALEGWTAILYNNHKQVHSNQTNFPGSIIQSYLERINEFQTIIASLDKAFIWGLQPFLYSKSELTDFEQYHVRHINNQSIVNQSIKQLYSQLVTKINDTEEVDLINFHNLFKKFGNNDHFFYDMVHPSPEGHKIMANIYLEQIFNLLNSST